MKKSLFVILALTLIFCSYSCKKETTGTINLTVNLSDSLFTNLVNKIEIHVRGTNGAADEQDKIISSNHEKLRFTVEPGRWGVSATFQTWDRSHSPSVYSVTQTQTKYSDITAGSKADVTLDFQ